MRAAMEDLFKAAKVDIVFAGHVHAYERMHNVYNNITTPGAPVYINIGDAGNREGPNPQFPTALVVCVSRSQVWSWFSYGYRCRSHEVAVASYR